MRNQHEAILEITAANWIHEQISNFKCISKVARIVRGTHTTKIRKMANNQVLVPFLWKKSFNCRQQCCATQQKRVKRRQEANEIPANNFGINVNKTM